MSMSLLSSVAETPDEVVWPELSHSNKTAMIIINVGSFFLAYILLRVIWKPESQAEKDKTKEMQQKIAEVQKEHNYGALSIAIKEIEADYGRTKVIKEIAFEGEDCSDCYAEDWYKTFDGTLSLMMLGSFIVLAIWTTVEFPALWTDQMFWVMQLPKLAIMMTVAIIGGLTCRQFCKVNERGYIKTSKHSVFKVNYTRKFQHFAAYIVPLVVTYKTSNATGPILDFWGDWFTMLAFFLLIKPIREATSFFMLQFNSLDRPEDRPHTLKWIIGGNILPGLFMIVFWRWLLSYSGQEDLAYIFIFVTGVGDGLAEPVGIWTGKHHYWTSALGSNKLYRRSLEGSSCLYISSLVFTTMFYYSFDNQYQYWTTMVILPPLMTYAEAVSPHTMDTPFLMGLGGLVVWLVSHIDVTWISEN